MKFINRQFGFTLIELLVVISIISLLSTIILVSLGGVKIKSANAKYLTEISSLRKAILLYRSANNDTLPVCSDGLNGCPTTNANPSAFDISLAPLVTGGYIPKIPRYNGQRQFAGEPYIRTVYLPNYYSGPNSTEFSCDPVSSSNWKKGSLPGIFQIWTNQKLPLSEGYTQCEDSPTLRCTNTTSSTFYNLYCVPLGY